MIGFAGFREFTPAGEKIRGDEFAGEGYTPLAGDGTMKITSWPHDERSEAN